MATSIKICGLDPETLAAALDAGADMVGLVFFAKSPRHVTPEAARALAARARNRAEIVALTVDADNAALDEIVRAVEPDYLQMHGRETPERVEAVQRRFGVSVIKALGVSEAADLARAADYAGADALLIDAKPPTGAALPGGNGVPFDWRLARGFAPRKPWLLSGGLTTQNVAEAIRESLARSVDVSSGVESAPGVKDPALIAAFIAAAREGFAAVERD